MSDRYLCFCFAKVSNGLEKVRMASVNILEKGNLNLGMDLHGVRTSWIIKECPKGLKLDLTIIIGINMAIQKYEKLDYNN